MAIYGIGAFYGTNDVSQDFIDNEVSCIGWTNEEAPSLYNIMRQIKVGDIVYIKSFNPKSGLFIKAVGIVTDNNIQDMKAIGLGHGIKTRWLWTGSKNIVELHDKYNVKNNTLYEEYDVQIQRLVIDLMTV